MEKTIEKNEEMFCYQCQETAKNIACTKRGVCGKTSDVANIEDLLVWVTKGLGEILTKTKISKTYILMSTIICLLQLQTQTSTMKIC